MTNDSSPPAHEDAAASTANTAFDAQFRDLAAIEPSELLVARTLAAFRRERARSAIGVRLFAGFGMVAMAAMTLLVVSDPPTTGNPENLVERGEGEARPRVDLKVAVRLPSGEVARFATNQRYDAGTTLLFRVSTSGATSLSLRRDDVVLWSGELPAGEHDLPVAYTLEAGEPAARFIVEGGRAPALVAVPAVPAEVQP